MRITLSVNQKAVARRLALTSDRIRTASVRAIQRAVFILERDLKMNTLRGERPPRRGLLRPGAVGQALAVGTGAARQSLTANVVTSGNTVVGTVGSPKRYVAFHERGGVIRGNPWLAIPTIFARTFGLTGYGPKPRVPGAFFQKSKSGALFLFGVKGSGKRRKIVPLLLLKRSITLRPRRMFATTLAYMKPTILTEVRSALLAVRVAA